MLQSAQITLVNNIRSSLFKKNRRKRNCNVMDSPESNVEDCLIVISYIYMGLYGFQKTFANINSLFLLSNARGR